MQIVGITNDKCACKPATTQHAHVCEANFAQLFTLEGSRQTTRMQAELCETVLILSSTVQQKKWPGSGGF
jgi:hypothetical protein